ncbi:MAG: hypothetical protein AUK48_05990 [Oscillatoriales cyanobacterium CG2_30_44_21]|nr:MAG: hypothetical protein AUK48_05990 [Oscillatoriales cyanobacterium CG2_30_44_21]
MARYTQHFLVEITPENLHSTIITTLGACNLVITYETDDYVIAQEMETNASFAQLVTVEVLIHRSEIEGNQAKLTIVTKNAELPLRVDNYCHRISDSVSKAFCDSPEWKLLEVTAGF